MLPIKNTCVPGKFIHYFIGSINIFPDFVLGMRGML